MPFAVRGTIDGEPAEVTWARGAITGTPAALARIDRVIALGGIVLEAVPSRWRAALAPGWVALPTILAAFDDGAEVSGRVPEPPWFRDPPGTVY